MIFLLFLRDHLAPFTWSSLLVSRLIVHLCSTRFFPYLNDIHLFVCSARSMTYFTLLFFLPFSHSLSLSSFPSPVEITSICSRVTHYSPNKSVTRTLFSCRKQSNKWRVKQSFSFSISLSRSLQSNRLHFATSVINYNSPYKSDHR